MYDGYENRGCTSVILPEFIDLSNWAASLIIDFPDDNIPLLYNDDRWREWGDLLIQEESFVGNNAPSTLGYTDWKPWAQDVYLAVDGN